MEIRLAKHKSIKIAGRPIPIDDAKVDYLVKSIMLNALYSTVFGVMMKVNPGPYVMDFTDPLGNQVVISIEIKLDNHGDYNAAEAFWEGNTVRITYDDVGTLLHANVIDPEEAEEILEYLHDNGPIPNVQFGRSDAMNARFTELKTTLLHELIHALEPKEHSYSKYNPAEIYHLNKKDKYSPDGGPIIYESEETYLSDPYEIRAFTREIIFELEYTLKTSQMPLKTALYYLPTLRRYLVANIESEGQLSKIIQKIYSDLYQWMTENDYDPKTGKKTNT